MHTRWWCPTVDDNMVSFPSACAWMWGMAGKRSAGKLYLFYRWKKHLSRNGWAAVWVHVMIKILRIVPEAFSLTKRSGGRACVWHQYRGNCYSNLCAHPHGEKRIRGSAARWHLICRRSNFTSYSPSWGFRSRKQWIDLMWCRNFF